MPHIAAATSKKLGLTDVYAWVEQYGRRGVCVIAIHKLDGSPLEFYVGELIEGAALADLTLTYSGATPPLSREHFLLSPEALAPFDTSVEACAMRAEIENFLDAYDEHLSLVERAAALARHLKRVREKEAQAAYQEARESLLPEHRHLPLQTTVWSEAPGSYAACFRPQGMVELPWEPFRIEGREVTAWNEPEIAAFLQRIEHIQRQKREREE